MKYCDKTHNDLLGMMVSGRPCSWPLWLWSLIKPIPYDCLLLWSSLQAMAASGHIHNDKLVSILLTFDDYDFSFFFFHFLIQWRKELRCDLSCGLRNLKALKGLVHQSIGRYRIQYYIRLRLVKDFYAI